MHIYIFYNIIQKVLYTNYLSQVWGQYIFLYDFKSLLLTKAVK